MLWRSAGRGLEQHTRIVSTSSAAVRASAGRTADGELANATEAPAAPTRRSLALAAERFASSFDHRCDEVVPEFLGERA